MTDSDLSLLEKEEELRAYLRGRGLVKASEPVQVVQLGGGISNKIVKIVTPDKTLVIKQAQPKLRVPIDWYASIDRILIEADCMQELYDVLPSGTVPRIDFIDREQYLYGMECAPEGSVLWKSELLAGKIDPAVAAHVGKIIGLMHGQSRGNARLAARFQDNHILHDLRLDPCLNYLSTVHTDLRYAFDAQIDRLDKTKLCLVHGDYTPKNMLHHEDRLILLDYEIAHWGDPALDSAFLIAHLLLKAVRKPEWAEGYIVALRAFWRTYVETCDSFDARELEQGAATLTPFLVLARIDSKSPVEYLTLASDKQRARDLAIHFITHPTCSLEEIYSSLVAEPVLRVGVPAS